MKLSQDSLECIIRQNMSNKMPPELRLQWQNCMWHVQDRRMYIDSSRCTQIWHQQMMESRPVWQRAVHAPKGEIKAASVCLCPQSAWPWCGVWNFSKPMRSPWSFWHVEIQFITHFHKDVMISRQEWKQRDKSKSIAMSQMKVHDDVTKSSNRDGEKLMDSQQLKEGN